MGTNFYWNDQCPIPERELKAVNGFEYPPSHIGKRSAAGPYCFDCGVTLCKGGESAVHQGVSIHLVRDFEAYALAERELWHDACPKCGAKWNQQGHDAAMVELGFSDPAVETPRGVAGCSSFSWAQHPELVGTLCRMHPDKPIISDEYGQVLTGAEFGSMLEHNCPIQFTHSLGRVFC